MQSARKRRNSSDSGDGNKEPVHVFCRIRPLANDDDEYCIEIQSPTTVTVCSPTDRIVRKSSRHVFSEVFAPGSTQREVFESVARPLLEDLVNGKNGLLFTYGVTNSGKTFTLSGDHDDPGIMPRCINAIFNSVSDYQTEKFVIKSDRMNGFEVQSEKEAAHDRLLDSKSSSTMSLRKKGTATDSRHSYANDEFRIDNVNRQNLYAVFISYIEIYNNSAYDLLDESSGKQLQNKIMREDCRKDTYINNIVEVEVKSAGEAFHVLAIGQKRRRIGHTLLNAESSRSHSVLNIRIVQLERDVGNRTGLIPDKNYLKIGRLSLVDLAGSERSNRTQNTGIRLKEASNINNSLLTLRTCIEVLRDNQMNNVNRLVPYRDSRLTYYFKSYFEGDGRVQMIVCVNPSTDDFEETQQVMKFAELSQDVKVKKGVSRYTPYGKLDKVKNTPSTPATVIRTPRAVPKVFNSAFPKINFNLENPEECIEVANSLLRVLKQRRENAEAYRQHCDGLIQSFRKKLIKATEENVLVKSEVQSLRSRIEREKAKSENVEGHIGDLFTKQENLEEEIAERDEIIRQLRTVIDEKDTKINWNCIERERVKCKIEAAKHKQSRELDECLRRQREELNAQMLSKDVKLEKVKRLLEDDADCPFQNSPVLTGTTQTEIVAKSEAEIQTVCSTWRSRATGTTPQRRRRSRSAGDVWLEHNSVRPVALGTVLQPTMKKRKSVGKLTKAADVTDPKLSKYCLIAQEQDSAGELETKLYKADVVPTCGGGAQVIFNDVERLRQESP